MADMAGAGADAGNPDDPEAAARRRWVEQVYDPFRERARRDLFLSLAVFCNQNRPEAGYYFEFGCHGARTMRLA
jgi:hypothetical protein